MYKKLFSVYLPGLCKGKTLDSFFKNHLLHTHNYDILYKYELALFI
ncbi:hypothetical protein SAMN04488100_101110 [Alkalibacterium putridalgicola]|uniref:Uncharacterized protein n=1 Tax=Alkalibacterium putridalgicola TaxID=426703 RepID=A0A1H7Q360_9LACT|nr:hypothetical protein SAMN04488100_101110 [Alkalibacterium putridalgicola]